MSSQRGNVKKKGAPKHQNRTAFKNNMHDTSKLTKALNTMTIGGVCDKCRETIEWKIKYKKYKPLTQAKKCTKCSQKTVKHAYNIICAPCAKDQAVCAKCGSKDDSVNPFALTPSEQAAQDSKLEAELKVLSERKRRAFFRMQNKGFPDATESAKEAEHLEDKETEDISDEEEEEEEEDFNDDVENDLKEEDRLKGGRDNKLVDGTDGLTDHDKETNPASSCEKNSLDSEQGTSSNIVSTSQPLSNDTLVDTKVVGSSTNQQTEDVS